VWEENWEVKNNHLVIFSGKRSRSANFRIGWTPSESLNLFGVIVHTGHGDNMRTVSLHEFDGSMFGSFRCEKGEHAVISPNQSNRIFVSDSVFLIEGLGYVDYYIWIAASRHYLVRRCIRDNDASGGVQQKAYRLDIDRNGSMLGRFEIRSSLGAFDIFTITATTVSRPHKSELITSQKFEISPTVFYTEHLGVRPYRDYYFFIMESDEIGFYQIVKFLNEVPERAFTRINDISVNVELSDQTIKPDEVKMILPLLSAQPLVDAEIKWEELKEDEERQIISTESCKSVSTTHQPDEPSLKPHDPSLQEAEIARQPEVSRQAEVARKLAEEKTASEKLLKLREMEEKRAESTTMFNKVNGCFYISSFWFFFLFFVLFGFFFLLTDCTCFGEIFYVVFSVSPIFRLMSLS